MADDKDKLPNDQGDDEQQKPQTKPTDPTPADDTNPGGGSTEGPGK